MRRLQKTKLSHLRNWMNYLFVLQGQKDKNTGLDLKLVVVSVKLFIAWWTWSIESAGLQASLQALLPALSAPHRSPLAGQGRQMRLLDWLDAGEAVEPEHLGVLSQLKMLLS